MHITDYVKVEYVEYVCNCRFKMCMMPLNAIVCARTIFEQKN